jgi:selenocysteine-specific elongation factor
MRCDLVDRVTAAGPAGVDIAAFDDRERSVLSTLDSVVVDATTARLADVADPYADHPYLGALLAGGFAPPQPEGVDRGELRELIRRGHVVTRDGLYFHESTVVAAGVVAAELLVANPDGFTVAQFRDATGASRKFALPLVSELDARGVTRRRDDVRIAGPRLPR